MYISVFIIRTFSLICWNKYYKSLILAQKNLIGAKNFSEITVIIGIYAFALQKILPAVQGIYQQISFFKCQLDQIVASDCLAGVGVANLKHCPVPAFYVACQHCAPGHLRIPRLSCHWYHCVSVSSALVALCRISC